MAMTMCKGGFISNLRIHQIFFLYILNNGWQEKLLLRFPDLYQLVFSSFHPLTHYFAYVIFEWSLTLIIVEDGKL